MDERIHVEIDRSPKKCPYCHDAVEPSRDDWLACADCLARHHEECWRELGRCSSCGSNRSLALGASRGSVTTISAERLGARQPPGPWREKLFKVLSPAVWIGSFVLLVVAYDRIGCFAFVPAIVTGVYFQSVLRSLLLRRSRRVPQRAAAEKKQPLDL